MLRVDVIVVGVGGMGSAAVDALAARGKRVLGLEQFGVAHDRGASHGRTRIVRQAYFENPAYIPLLRRSYELWDGLPTEWSLRRVGCLLLGAETSPVLTGAARSAARWDVPVQPMTAAETRERFPQFAPSPGDVAIFEPGAGYVRPEETVHFLINRARGRGAEIATGQRVEGWEVGDRVRVRTADLVVEADQLVLTAGAWTPTLAASLALPIRIERRVMHFFAPLTDPRRFAPGTMPTFIWDLAAEDSIYGFPLDGADGVKVGFHNRGPVTDPDRRQPAASPAEVDQMCRVLADRLPEVGAGRHVRSVGCMYALTPDQDFALGFVPGYDDRVVVAAGFSGHGFKFVPVVGEIIADLLVEGPTPYELDFLSPARFLTSTPNASSERATVERG